jgi:acetylglutamate/LysW-gamma-L-alpha-aminoadipate kinase
MVIKIGGNAEVSVSGVLREIAHLYRGGQQLVLVHGGSGLTDALSAKLGHAPRTITSPGGMTSRYTDAETLSIFAMATAGEINTQMVSWLQGEGINALGLSGVDGRLLVARRKEAVRSITPDGRVQVVRDDYTGRIECVNGALLRQLLAEGYVPVVAPLALGQRGERLNVDGDRAAAAIAVELQAEALLILTNVPGLLTDPQDASTIIPTIAAERLDEYLPYAQGRMRKKLMGASEALQGGVPRVHIGNAPLSELLGGAGTVISKARG